MPYPAANFPPLGTFRWRGAVRGLLLVNGLTFLIQQVAGWGFVLLFGLVPWSVTHQLTLWQLASYMFLHGGLLHLLFNLLVLWMFGTEIEGHWGPREFLKYYLLCGLGAALLTLLLGPNSRIPTIGASGAIYGILVAYGMMFPNRTVLLYFFFPMRAKHLVILLAGLEFLLSFSSASSGIARFAHLGGMLTGYLYLKLDWRIPAWRTQLVHLWHRRRLRVIGGGRDDEELRREVDRILDKILEQGRENMTPGEEETLRRAGRRPEERYH